MLASVVTHGGITKTAQAAMGELTLALDLFDRTSKQGGRATKFLVSPLLALFSLTVNMNEYSYK